jgi:hypothetical protein
MAWTVTVRANDGEDDGAPRSATVLIENSLPTNDAGERTPKPAFEGSTLVATVVGPADRDGDELRFR